MRTLEMYLTADQIHALEFMGIEHTVVNKIVAGRTLVTFDSQQQFNIAFRILS